MGTSNNHQKISNYIPDCPPLWSGQSFDDFLGLPLGVIDFCAQDLNGEFVLAVFVFQVLDTFPRRFLGLLASAPDLVGVRCVFPQVRDRLLLVVDDFATSPVSLEPSGQGAST